MTTETKTKEVDPIAEYADAIVNEAVTLTASYNDIGTARAANRELVRSLIKAGHLSDEQRQRVDAAYPSLFKPRNKQGVESE